MALIWTNDLSVKNELIDAQHRELFERVNIFMEAVKGHKGHEEISSIIEFLECYIVEHFSTEERFMADMGYPWIDKHKAQHAEFIKTFEELKRKYEKFGGGLDVIIAAQIRLGDWLRRHIPYEDKKMVAFLWAKG